MSDTKSNRDILIAHVTAFLVNRCGLSEASEYGAASDFGNMNGEPVGAIGFSEHVVEAMPVDPSRKYKGKFCIDEKNGYAIVSYENKGVLSGRGGAWQISLDGTVETLYTMMR